MRVHRKGPPRMDTSLDPSPTSHRTATSYRTAGGILINRTSAPATDAELTTLVADLDRRRGGVLSSGVDYPGRYSRWHVGYVDPPVEIVARGRQVEAMALNERGRVLLPAIAAAMAGTGDVLARDPDRVQVLVPPSDAAFTEEERSRQPTVFSALRAITALFASPEDPHLGLYGAYGYDLAFQFEPVRLRHDRTQVCAPRPRAASRRRHPGRRPQAGDLRPPHVRLHRRPRRSGRPGEHHRSRPGHLTNARWVATAAATGAGGRTLRRRRAQGQGTVRPRGPVRGRPRPGVPRSLRLARWLLRAAADR